MQKNTEFQNGDTQDLRRRTVDRRCGPRELCFELRDGLQIVVRALLVITATLMPQRRSFLSRYRAFIVALSWRRGAVCVAGLAADAELGKLGGAPAEGDEFDDEHAEDAREGDGEGVGLRCRMKPGELGEEVRVRWGLTYSCHAGLRQGEVSSSMAGSSKWIKAVAI